MSVCQGLLVAVRSFDADDADQLRLSSFLDAYSPPVCVQPVDLYCGWTFDYVYTSDELRAINN